VPTGSETVCSPGFRHFPKNSRFAETFGGDWFEHDCRPIEAVAFAQLISFSQNAYQFSMDGFREALPLRSFIERVRVLNAPRKIKKANQLHLTSFPSMGADRLPKGKSSSLTLASGLSHFSLKVSCIFQQWHVQAWDLRHRLAGDPLQVADHANCGVKHG
jgi:hypothetical protein